MPRDLDARELPRRAGAKRRLGELNQLAAELPGAARLMGNQVPEFTVGSLSARTGNAAVIEFAPTPGGGAGLQRSSDSDLVAQANELVESIAPVLGVAESQAAEFTAAPGVTDVAGAVRVVRITQRYRGIPVFHATSALHFGPDDEPRTLLNETYTVAGDPPAEPALAAVDAVGIAAAYLATPADAAERDQFGNPLAPPPIDLAAFLPRPLARGFTADQPIFFEGEPFATPIRVSLVWFPRTADDLRLAWEIELTLADGSSRHRTLVDAHTGGPLYSRQLVQGIRATAAVFSPDGGSPRQVVELPLPLDGFGVPVPEDLNDRLPDWVAADGTVGNSTVAIFAADGRVLTARLTGDEASFVPDSDSGNDQLVLNAFYFACWAHDFFYLLGFREQDWNFQADNGRRGGVGGDPVQVEVHPGRIRLTASMLTQAEGTSPILKLGVNSNGRHCALDGSVVIHEFSHGVTNRLVGGPDDIRALDDDQCRGMGEGWSDYFACLALGVDVIGSWLADNPAGIRKFRYDESFPAETNHFGKLGKGRYASSEHAVGEIWAATLMDMTRRVGRTLGLRLVINALKLAGSNPSFLAMRDAILAAAGVLVEAGELDQDDLESTRAAIWAAFARFGMGPGASCQGASFRGIVTDFTFPAGEPS
ncbi:MAG: M36 family metallopeptidase [Propionibacteriaceae bacterium]|nr:M36 family metallopeptidase [Propionibacteriaceae bacterium]